MVEGGGFEPPKAEPADLQSDPFGRSGTPPLSDKQDIIFFYKIPVKYLFNLNLTYSLLQQYRQIKSDQNNFLHYQKQLESVPSLSLPD